MGQFKNRILLNWINDISSVERVGVRWPAIDIDDQLIQDYKDYIDAAAEFGFNGFVIWGFFVNHSWPVNLKDCFPESRKQQVQTIIDYAHQKGIKVYTGLGVYSWGFEELIRTYPELKSSDLRKAWGQLLNNDQAMCFHKPQAREWMEKIIDFIVSETDIDGFGLQAADKGRCMCEACSQMDDTEYYCTVCEHTARYIKEHYPDKFVSVGGWGMSFSSENSIEPIRRLSRYADYITDVSETAMQGPKNWRKELISEMEHGFGTGGGIIVVPPHTWDRLGWFLPHIKTNGSNLKQLADDGGDSFEYFTGVLSNPGDEVTLKAIGFLLAHPEASFEEAAHVAVKSCFQPKSDLAAEKLAALMLRAEHAFFDCLDHADRGEFDFEPLESAEVGDPVYLQKQKPDALMQYLSDLEQFRNEFLELKQDVENETAIERTIISVSNVIKDVKAQLSHGQAE